MEKSNPRVKNRKTKITEEKEELSNINKYLASYNEKKYNGNI